MHYNDDERDTEVNLLRRVCSEYTEMPGLQLTLAQASRLWNMNAGTSAHLLERLVDASFLRRAGDRYIRADSGRSCA
jgi:hypothetical protein